MKRLRWIPITAVLMFLAAWQARAGGVKVIANPSVKANSISVSDLKSVFLEDLDSLSGSHVEPVLAKGGPAHAEF